MIARPVILTEVTIPTGGWTIKFYFSVSSEHDTPCTATLAAGTYFVSGDNQADDLLYELQLKVQAAIVALGGDFATSHYFYACHRNPIDDSGLIKTRLLFSGFTSTPGRSLKVAWSESSPALLVALGVASSADVIASWNFNSTALEVTPDYQIGYCWASDDNGQLAELDVYDRSETVSVQQRGPTDGRVKTAWVGYSARNSLRIDWMQRSLAYSGDSSYGSAPPYPLVANKGLECWWREARQGKRFRVYEHRVLKDPSGENLVLPEIVMRTADSTTTLTDSSKAWATNRWAGSVLAVTVNTWRGLGRAIQYFNIASNTATELTVSKAHPDGLDLWVSAETFAIWPWTYRTYVVNLDKMKEFAPEQMSRDLDYYGITIPLYRYVAP